MSRPLEWCLNCTRCHEFTDYYHEADNVEVVRCEECGKRHSTDSTFAVTPGKTYDRDEAGTLMESVP